MFHGVLGKILTKSLEFLQLLQTWLEQILSRVEVKNSKLYTFYSKLIIYNFKTLEYQLTQLFGIINLHTNPSIFHPIILGFQRWHFILCLN